MHNLTIKYEQINKIKKGLNMKTLPLLNYPSTILWIDDDEWFSKAISKSLKIKDNFKFLSSSKNALEFINNYNSPLHSLNLLKPCIEDEKYDLADHLPVDINIKALKTLVSNPNKNSEISILIVDYNLPDMNGLDLLRQINDIPAKKILLTGEATLSDAVLAFNEGIIDVFIKKDSENLLTDLQNNILELKRKFFIDSTLPLLNHLQTESPIPLSDPMLTSFMEKLFNEYSIEEFFLLDKKGNLAGLNNKNEKIYFIINSDRSLSSYHDLYNENQEGKDLLKMIDSHNLTPFFGAGKEAWQIDPKEWSKFLHPCQKIEGKETYYVAVIPQI